MNARIAFVMVAALAACGGKAVVDGTPGSGGAGGDSSTTSSTLDTSGFTSAATGMTTTCADIEAQWAMAIENAKACVPGEVEPCTRFVPADLKNCCTASVAVNAADAQIDATLVDLFGRYGDQGCRAECAVDCPPGLPVSGSCDPQTGACNTIQG